MKTYEELLKENEDLKKRLSEVLKMDKISNNQELQLMKNQIQEGLQLEYDDYQSSKNSELSEDLATAYKLSLKRTFRILERLGINFIK